MAENSSDAMDLWDISFEIDEGKLMVNGKDASKLENLITQGAIDAGLSWWEFAATLLYIGVGQIAGKDNEVRDTQALQQYTGLLGHLYSLYLQSLAQGAIEVVKTPEASQLN